MSPTDVAPVLRPADVSVTGWSVPDRSVTVTVHGRRYQLDVRDVESIANRLGLVAALVRAGHGHDPQETT